MNLTFISGVFLAFAMIIWAMLQNGGLFSFDFKQLGNFLDIASVLIVIGGTIMSVIASYPGKVLKSFPKHFAIVLNQKKFNPHNIIEELVEFAQIARKNGLLALEEKANALEDPFFKQSIMLIVDGNDADKVRDILVNDIEQLSARHDLTAGMYERASANAPAFGMIGTLVGLINMLQNMDPTSGSSTIGKDMGVALITTLYGTMLANIVFNPIANNLRTRDEEECLCRQIIVEGVMAIQAGENPKFIRDKLLTFVEQNKRGEEGGGGKKGKKGKGGGGEEG